MTRRARFHRRMFREPSFSRSGPSIAVRRGQVEEDYHSWVHGTYEEDPQAFEIAFQIASAERRDDHGRAENIYAQLPPGLRSRVRELARRIVQSERNYEAAYDAARPRRSMARRYTPRGAR